MTKFENEFDLITAIKDGDHNAYSYLFSKYYKDLVLYGGTIIPNQEICEDIVQNIFIYIWENRKNIKIDSLKSYLIRAVRNSCLDEIKHNKIMNEYSTFILTQNNIFNNDTEEYILYSELNIQIQQAIQKLPVDERTALVICPICFFNSPKHIVFDFVSSNKMRVFHFPCKSPIAYSIGHFGEGGSADRVF